jgi:hypothetical protein
MPRDRLETPRAPMKTRQGPPPAPSAHIETARARLGPRPAPVDGSRARPVAPHGTLDRPPVQVDPWQGQRGLS